MVRTPPLSVVRQKRTRSPEAGPLLPAPTTLIVGGGLGGLALACRLAQNGEKVAIYEKNASLGGRVAQKKVKGYTIDLGPTFLLMPGEFEELFAYCGKKFADYVPILPLEPSYRLHFADQTTLDVSANVPTMLREITRVSPGDQQGFFEFLAHENTVYDAVYSTFISRSPESVWEILLGGNLSKLLNTDGLTSMWDHMDQFFGNDKLKLAFSFQSMYLGQAPTHTPATYAIIPYVELAQGVWYPQNGMASLVHGIEKLARELGVTIHTGKKVERILIEDKKAVGIALADGNEVRAGRVVSNLDLPATYSTLIPTTQRSRFTDENLARMEYGCSAFMLYLGIDRDYSHLLHHNVFFSENYLENFQEIFQDQQLSENPSFYVNVPTRTNPSLAPKGKQLLYVLVPVPNQKRNPIDWSTKKEAFAQKIIAHLEKRGLTDLSKHVKMMELFTPDDWKELGGMHFASTFGLSPLFTQSSIFRPKQKSEEFENLFFVGASTHPGSGMPMVLISARTCTEKILSKKN